MKLAPWHRASVYGAVAALWLTGAAWLASHHLLAKESSIGRLPHPWEPTWLAIHGIAGAAALFVFGSLLVPHILRAWTVGRNRFSGSTVAAALAVLAATGLGLYYVADDGAREAIGLAHWVLGLASPALLALHVASGRRRP
jgi:hypothetical protein